MADALKNAIETLLSPVDAQRLHLVGIGALPVGKRTQTISAVQPKS